MRLVLPAVLGAAIISFICPEGRTAAALDVTVAPLPSPDPDIAKLVALINDPDLANNLANVKNVVIRIGANGKAKSVSV